MSFKALNDRRRLLALPHFLGAADLLPSLLITLLISKRIPSIFEPRAEEHPQSVMPEDYRESERRLRIIHFASLIVAGATSPGQHLFWFTDEDEVAANPKRLRQLVDDFALVSSHYLRHELGNLRIGTAASDTGSRDIEDLVAIPDLVAGVATEVMSTYDRAGIGLSGDLIAPVTREVSDKSRRLLLWLASDRPSAMARVTMAIEDNLPVSRSVVRTLRWHAVEM